MEHMNDKRGDKHLDAVVASSNAALESSPPELPEDASLPEPNTLAALKHAIAKDDFGVVAGDDGGKPLPPLAAIRAYKTAGGAVPTAPPSRTPPKIVASMDAMFGLATAPPSHPTKDRGIHGCH
eukprot:5268492-Prymnesium_polylepis.1